MRATYYFGCFIAWLLPVLNVHAATELEQRAAISGSVRSLFLAGNFPELERMSQSYRTQRSRTASGLWKLSLFYAGIDAALGRDDDNNVNRFSAIEEKTKSWRQKYPHSPTAHIVHSMMLIAQGWAHRGGGYANSVRPEAWARFDEKISRARKHLETHKSIASTDPRWYETMLIIARAQGWARPDFDRLVLEAVTREPSFYQNYFVALEYLLPKWHGGTAEIEAFAAAAVRRTQKQEGQGMYARIYWFASQTQFGNNLFSESLVVWPNMKKGFEDVIRRYPDAWNLNNYAKFACLANDLETAKVLLERTESRIVPEAWSPFEIREACKQWVSRNKIMASRIDWLA